MDVTIHNCLIYTYFGVSEGVAFAKTPTVGMEASTIPIAS